VTTRRCPFVNLKVEATRSKAGDLGLTEVSVKAFKTMLDSVRELNHLHNRKISIVGWSLGGIYARELAKIAPDQVRSVVSLGSPFGGSPKSTNAWKVYELASGQSVDDVHDVAVSVAPAVPTTAIYSRTDGICAWQGCIEKNSAQSESIEVEGSHWLLIRLQFMRLPTDLPSPRVVRGNRLTAVAGGV
jgi:pimeloyl-ACP methyl ester carboxylesterase